jgi:signal transduction histidine kinase
MRALGNAVQIIIPAGTEFLSAGAEMGARIRAFDWSATKLGPLARWSQSLKTAVSICIGSPLPTALWWGRELVLIYNDAYARLLGTEHPIALGTAAQNCGTDERLALVPVLQGVLSSGQAVSWAGEEGFTSVYSAVKDHVGKTVGVFSTCIGTIPEHGIQERRELERQLFLLVEASSTLLASPQQADVIHTVMSLAERLIRADAYAMWRKTSSTAWRAIHTVGLSENYAREVTHDAGGEWLPAGPQVYADPENDSMLDRRRSQYRAEGIRAMLTVPLRLHGSVSGTLVFYYRTRHDITETEKTIAGALGNLAAAALGTSDLYERQKSLRAQAERFGRRATFLAEAGTVLVSSLDYPATLANVAELVLPFFADWCGVNIVDENGVVRRLVLKHQDAGKLPIMSQAQRIFPSRRNALVRLALRTARAQCVAEITDDLLVKHVRHGARLTLLRSMGLKSMICAPLVVRGRTIGVLTFATAESGRFYTRDDVEFAEELAQRTALAVDNARLFADVTRERERVQETNRTLQETVAELRRANEDLEQFAFSASHDLREPLRTIAVYSQLLEQHCGPALDEEARSFIQYAVSGAKRMEALIKDLLSYVQATRAVGGEVSDVDSFAVLEQTLSNLQASIEESGAVISVDRLPVVRVQTVHLEQLFQNLIGNAIKYRGTEPPRIEISARREGIRWKFYVKDNGIGIDPRYAKQVFGIFKRLHNSDSYSGTGIGLAICQKIVERYGGRIWVDSDLGTGATFYFTLPGA